MTFSSKTLSSNFDTFIQTQFHSMNIHPRTFSSNDIFIQKIHMWDNQYSPCLCESVAGRRPTPLHKHGLCPPFGFRQAFMWSIAGRRPAMLHMKVC